MNEFHCTGGRNFLGNLLRPQTTDDFSSPELYIAGNCIPGLKACQIADAA